MFNVQEKVQTTIEKLRDEYISSGEAESEYQINNGLCVNFASDIILRLKSEIPSLQDICGENFMRGEDGDESENDVWDQALLSEHWPKISPTNGLTWADMDQIGFGFHVWVSCEGRHYDAECPEGVDNFFNLPLFRRYIEGYVKGE